MSNIKTIKKRFVPQLFSSETVVDSGEDFESLLNQLNIDDIKEDTVVKGQVVDICGGVVVVDIGRKNEGRIPKEQFLISSYTELPQIGDLIDVYVEKLEGRRGTCLSREKAIREESWTILKSMYEQKQYVEGTIFGRVKGGFTVDLSGVVAFLPGSQVDVRPIKDISPLMGIKQQFEILKMDEKLGNVVVSRRSILEASMSDTRDKVLSEIQEGEVREGIIKNIVDYGAFVDLGCGVDGLLHITDIAWSRLNHPSEILSIGQKVKVKVIKFNQDTKRISLGMKQLETNSWDGMAEEFPIGKVMTGKVTNIVDFGAYIELKDGIEGFVHSSEVSWVKSGQHPKKALSIGQEVKFTILDIDMEKHRFNLSIKQCQENPLLKLAEKYPVGLVVKAPIRNITDFGLFVGLEDNIDGLIHETDISWEGNGSELLKNYKKGEEVECKVLSVDTEKERIALGIKQLDEQGASDNADEFKKNAIVTCIVTDVREDGVEVSVGEKSKGFIKRNELSSEKNEQKPEKFAVGDKVDAKILNIEKPSRRLALSVKAYELEERQKAIKEYGSADSGASLGDILGAALGQQSGKNNK